MIPQHEIEEVLSRVDMAEVASDFLTLKKSGSGWVVTPFGAKIPVTGEKGELLTKQNVKEGEFILGVRPEHIVLADGPSEKAIPVTLEVNEMMGSELHLHVFTEDGTRLIVRVPTIDLTPEQRSGLVNGAKLYVTFEGKVMHFFNSETEKNLIY